MRQRILLLLLAAALAAGSLLTGCGPAGESEVPENPSQTESSQADPSSEEEESSQPESEPETEEKAEEPSSAAVEVPAADGSLPNPDTGPNLTEEEVELYKIGTDLREYLIKTLSPESYSYLSYPDGGVLTVGVVDEQAVRAAVDAYSGAHCQVVYQPAACSLAQVNALAGAIGNLDFPDGTTAITVPAEEWQGGGIIVTVLAADDADAEWIQSEMKRLADEQDFPSDSLFLYRREENLPPPGVNPDT